MVIRYKTRPCEIEAIQWTGKNIIEILDWGQGNILWNDVDDLFIDTLEGRMKADINDYIIKGLRGEFYPCKPNVFEKKYEKIK
jgi:hypothetical protein